MTKRRLTGSLVSMALAGALVTQVPAQETLTTDEETIRSLDEQERIAVLNEDLAALVRLWSEQLIVNNPQNGITATRSDVLDRVKRGLIRYSAFERRIEAIRFSDDIAIVMGSETVVRKGDAAAANMPIHRRYTDVWKKSGSTWHLIARHANVVAER